MHYELNQQVLQEIFHYDPITGKTFHKLRDLKYFDNSKGRAQWSCNLWNSRYAGKETFNVKDTKGYYQCSVFGKLYRAHRIIWLYMTDEWPEVIDHKNGIVTDNTWKNLRNVNRTINQLNKAKHKNNTSGFTGVVWHPGDEKWQAQVSVNGKTKYLGSFDTREEAAARRQQFRDENGYETFNLRA